MAPAGADESPSVMKELSKRTVSLINSGQIITSVNAVVKELIENSIDAEAENVEVRLDNFGLNKIWIKDDGTGVKKEDLPLMAKAHYTSKISDFCDLGELSSYGFRGEALSALATVADLTIQSKTSAEKAATLVTFDHEGRVKGTPSTVAGTKGTVITATNLFGNLPVRKSYHQKGNRAREDLKKVETTVTAFALVRPKLRLALYHNGKQLFVKSKSVDLGQSIAATFGQSCLHGLERIQHDHLFTIYVPKKDLGWQPDKNPSKADKKIFTFVNRRPVIDKKIEKMLKDLQLKSSKPSHLFVVCLTLPSGELDVNLDPNKYSVFYSKQTEVIQKMEIALHQYYDDGGACGSEDVKEVASKANTRDEPQMHLQNQAKPRDASDGIGDADDLNSSQSKSGQCNSIRLQDSGLEGKYKVSSDEKENARTLAPPMPDEFNVPERSWARGNLLSAKSGDNPENRGLVTPVQLIKQPPVLPDAFSMMVSSSSSVGAKSEKRRGSFSSSSGDYDNVELRMELKERMNNKRLKLDESALDTPKINQLFMPVSAPARGEPNQLLNPSPTTVEPNQLFKSSVKDRQKAREGVGNKTLERMAAPECTPRLEPASPPPKLSTKSSQKVQRSYARVGFDLSALRKPMAAKANLEPKANVAIVGQLKPSGFWVLCQNDADLKLANHHRLQEIAIYRKLMESYRFEPVHKLQRPVQVFDKPQWKPEMTDALRGLDTEPFDDNNRKVVDARLASNGFEVIISEDSATIIGVWDKSEMVGWDEFVKIVEAVSRNPDVRVEECRPLKMKRFLEGEAVRMQRQVPPSVSKLEVERLLSLVAEETSGDGGSGVRCLHGKKVISDALFTVPDRNRSTVTLPSA